MTRTLVLGGLTLAVLLAMWLAHAPEPSPARAVPADAAPRAVAPPPPPPPRLDVPRAVEVPRPAATAAIHGRVTERGRPVAGFPVELRHSAPETVTDADGEFRLDDLPPGGHLVVAEDRTTGRSARVEVQLAAGDDIEVELALVQTGRLHIEVVDGDGGPVLGATVAVLGPAAGASYFPADSTTDRAGAIDRLGLGVGEVTVVATVADTSAQLSLLVHGTRDRARVELPRHGGQRVAGVVRDDRGEPIARASVSLGAIETTTDGAGHFAFAPVLEGSYRIAAWRVATSGPKLIRWSRGRALDDHSEADVSAGALDVELVVPRMASLAGRVDGVGEHCLLELEGADVHEGMIQVHDGVIPPTAIRPGTYHLIASRGTTGAIATADVVLAPGAAQTVRLTATAAGAVRVRAVRYPRGTPVEGARCEGAFGAGGLTDAAGAATIGGMPPGRRTITCDVELAHGEATADIGSGATADARVWLVFSGGPGRSGAELDRRASPPTFTQVNPAGAASAAGIADGDVLLAIDGVELTPETADAAARFVRVSGEPYVARVRSKTGSYAIDLNVTPRR